MPLILMKFIQCRVSYPYGGTALIAGRDKTQVQQKRYRYTGKERNEHTNSSHQPPLLHQGLSTLSAKGLGT
jgi:hypothetical protein